MGRSLSCLLFCCSLLLHACLQEENKLDPDRYFAQLQLDSTELLLTVVADSLDVLRDIEWGAGGYLWYAEQKGTIGRIHIPTGQREVLWRVKNIYHRKSTGIFSLVLHPNFGADPYLYFHYTLAEKDSYLEDKIISRVVRLHWNGEKLADPHIILDSIPGNTYHNGSSMLIGLDGKLWLSTGDAGQTDKTQDSAFLSGKVLRINLDGTFPPDNPFPNSPVWSMGHRNIQGLTNNSDKVYASEHGPNNDDEINLIEAGQNYGWPDVHGFCNLDNETAFCQDHHIREPLISWTPTIAPAGLTYYNNAAVPEWKNSLLLATLKGRSLRVLKLSEDGMNIDSEHLYLQEIVGRIRDVAAGPSGEIYLATSNLDWHPVHQPWMYDSLPVVTGDRIIKLQSLSKEASAAWAKITTPLLLREEDEAIALEGENFAFSASEEEQSAGQKLYMTHCASCHRPDGHGNPGFIPPLVDSEWVEGNVGRLIDITLAGMNVPIVVNQVQYDGEMPGYSNLKDEEIRDILNYIRIEFGKVGGNIIAADVMHQRKGLP
jgi:glucose/arabinose dehydrogenase/mono/diheme cytochrome c family protein